MIGLYFLEETGAFGHVSITVTGQCYECFLCNHVIPDLQQRGSVCSLQTHLEESCLPLSSERFSSPCCHTSEDKLGTGPSWDQSPIRSLVLSQRSQKVRWLGESGLQPRLSPSASGVDPQWPEFPMAFGLLDHDSIFVNECGNNALCYSESQRNFRLG
ncbi:hypothetical protein TNCV_796681 [Trichonephila clavipes]|uniref:Uncharacterized protein n=1 Tax=Trichonephila clavipes TaxID=2585209 RepID=A0A8X7BM63_TRICX|nr:hypothetical protein TNCV_796681 [Trichonephila clavipes]